jgi:hypothetical protein
VAVSVRAHCGLVGIVAASTTDGSVHPVERATSTAHRSTDPAERVVSTTVSVGLSVADTDVHNGATTLSVGSADRSAVDANLYAGARADSRSDRVPHPG